MLKVEPTAAMSDATLIVRVWGMTLPQTGATYYHAQLGLADKGRAINGLVVCYVVGLGLIIYVILVFGQVKGAWSVPLLWSGWLSAQVPQHLRFIQIHHT